MFARKIILFAIFASYLTQPLSALAQGLPDDIRSAFGSVSPESRLDAPETEQEVYQFVPVIYSAMLFVGLIGVLAYLLYAGIRWITSGGDPKAIAGARQTAMNAVVGIMILATAYIIGLIFQRTVI